MKDQMPPCRKGFRKSCRQGEVRATIRPYGLPNDGAEHL